MGETTQRLRPRRRAPGVVSSRPPDGGAGDHCKSRGTSCLILFSTNHLNPRMPSHLRFPKYAGAASTPDEVGESARTEAMSGLVSLDPVEVNVRPLEKS